MNKIGALLILVAMLTYLGSCGGGGGDPAPAETEVQKATKLLTAGLWSMQTVQVDGTDRTTTYKDLKVTFTATGFSSTNGGAVWPATGTWKFKDDAGKTIERGDGLLVSVVELSSSKMVLSLTWSKTTLGGGRHASISGSHTFTFGK